MNDEPLLSDDDLRSVTSRRPPANPDLAALHDAFRSLGDSLTGAVPPLDEQSLLKRLQAQAANSEPVSVRPSRARALLFIAAGALAAAALIAIFRMPPATPARPIASSHHAPRDEAPTSHQAPRDEAPIQPTQPTYTWHDPLDDEIAIAAATMTRLSGSPRGVDASLLDMNETLSALSQELSTETL